ncbi:MAG: hypothetical protein ABSD03_09535 [Vulcanimicrobiaceae bacterium]
MMFRMKPPPTVDQIKRIIEQLPRRERTELTHWLLQRYIAGGLEADVEASERQGEAVAGPAGGGD